MHSAHHHKHTHTHQRFPFCYSGEKVNSYCRLLGKTQQINTHSPARARAHTHKHKRARTPRRHRPRLLLQMSPFFLCVSQELGSWWVKISKKKLHLRVCTRGRLPVFHLPVGYILLRFGVVYLAGDYFQSDHNIKNAENRTKISQLGLFRPLVCSKIDTTHIHDDKSLVAPSSVISAAATRRWGLS